MMILKLKNQMSEKKTGTPSSFFLKKIRGVLTVDLQLYNYYYTTVRRNCPAVVQKVPRLTTRGFLDSSLYTEMLRVEGLTPVS